MNSRISITGLGQHSAAGQGISFLRAALAQGYLAPTASRRVTTKKGDVEVPVYQAPDVNLPDELPESVRRRMARLSRMFFVSVQEALKDAFGDAQYVRHSDPTRVGLIIGTAFGCMEVANIYQRRVIFEGASGASPSLFASSIHNSLAAHLSISFGIQGPNSTVVVMEQTPLAAFSLAQSWLRQGTVDQVIVAVGDELSEYQPYVTAHSSSPQDGRLNPMLDSCTAVPGEGVAAFVLAREVERGYCRIQDLKLFAPEIPTAAYYQAGVFGREGQAAQLKRWSGDRPVQSHAALYGSLVTATAFEIVLAAIQIQKSPTTICCLQPFDDAGQTLLLAPL